VEEWARDRAGREKAHSAFFTFDVAKRGEEIWWHASVIDDAMARQILDEIFSLPEIVIEGTHVLQSQMVDQGLDIVINAGGTDRLVADDGLGLSMPNAPTTRPVP